MNAGTARLPSDNGLSGFGGAVAVTPDVVDSWDDPAPIISHEFELPDGVVSARLAVTSLGVHRTTVNGLRVGDDELGPGWTDYRSRLLWHEYDVAPLLVPGRNRIDALIGNGWYRGRLGRPARRDLYGPDLALLARLVVTMADGARIDVGTGPDWTWQDSELLRNDLYDGVVIDHRPTLERRGGRVRTVPIPARLERAPHPPVRVIDERAASWWPHGEGVRVDVGANVVGWLRVEVEVDGPERAVVVRHAEVLEHDELATRPLRDAAATDVHLLPSGPHTLVLDPVHTFHGFRYAHISGLTSDEVRSVTTCVVSSDLEAVGSWDSSDELLNRLHENVRRSARGNFVSIPTDCPQRDERLGWTADIQVFAPTATYLFDVRAFLESWLDDVVAAQGPDGSVPVVVPDMYRRAGVATAGWGDAAVLVPWQLYCETGDVEILRRYEELARRWIARVDSAVDADGIWRDGHQYGDWLDPNAPSDRPAQAMTDPSLVATAYRVRVLGVFRQWVAALGRAEDAAATAARHREARDQFRDRFVTRRGFLTSETQAAYALAIVFDLLDDGQTAAAGARLSDLVRGTDFTVGTGFLGTPVLLEALSRTGHHDVAVRLLLGTRSPSWLHPVLQGATTIWERWDSLLPDGTVNPGEMTSFNHYAFGAVATWMHERLGGLRHRDPGWRTATVTVPHWSPLDHVRTAHDSVAGPWSVAWRRRPDGSIALDLTVPDGARAVIRDGERETVVGVGRHALLFESNGSSALPSAGVTVRGAMDDETLWDRVVAILRVERPEWSRRDIAQQAQPYLDLPLPDLARIVGLSIPTRTEDAVREALQGATM
ncbi:family 78 glycoside hydrolase catalytic domain [Curtobacterium sp. 260]|uniref:family 78 glycoside hydrolase catalytic domain n=1 Tax=Curtobacterium sp. 260 TaxID=2817748 RepID=UPI0027814BFA|nr:family 78 glycoside hydrolase catalytic domain [Curtobacterium sp. 260]MDP9736802.1 alpha-L-rhamnosidase [Curtobacterium sp. 260]